MRLPQTHASRLILCRPHEHAAHACRLSLVATLLLVPASTSIRGSADNPKVEPVFGIGDRMQVPCLYFQLTIATAIAVYLPHQYLLQRESATTIRCGETR
jgi:hypothetical protein